MREEYERRGGFVRIFPTAETWELYSGYLESKTSMSYILANRLFHGRNLKGNVQLQVDALHGCHVVQYERKLPSLEARKKRRRHLSHRYASGKRRPGKESRTSLTASSSQEGEDCGALEKSQEVEDVFEPDSHRVLVAELKKQMVTQLDGCHAEALSSSQAAGDNARPKINLLNILHQGWDLSKVQARMAFSSYLQRVQQRLLAESQTNTIPAWPDKDNEQMELVIRFLKRAASNLQQDIKVVFPNPHLPLQDRRRILSYQLGEFIRCYNKETDYMARKHELSRGEHCISSTMFREYIAAASENDLEEVLTFYTQKNKSSSVFLGTKKSVKKGLREGNASSNCENSKTLPLARKDSSASEHSLSMRKIGSDPDIKATASPLPDQQSTVVTKPEVQASQHSSSFPVTLDSTHIHLQGDPSAHATLPLHCPPPPPPPQPPSYAQSLAKSHYCHSETLPEPPAYSSANAVAQSSRSLWTSIFSGSNTISGVPPTQGFRRIQSSTSSLSSSGAASSIPSATFTYDQKLSRPISSGQVIRRNSSDKLKSNSAGTFKELNSLSARSNQQAFISALQKLADKQVVRQYASSSHINLLTQQLSKMNLANRMLSRETFTLNSRERHPAAATASQRPVKAVHSGTDLCSSTGRRPAKDDEGAWNGQLQSTYGPTRGANPQQYYQPTQGRYQLQFAVQKLQQQRLQPQQFLDQSHFRHQAQFPDQTSASHAQASTNSSSCPPSSYHVWTNHSHGHSRSQTCVSPVLLPKPPSSVRDGQSRKTTTKRLIKQTSAESSASGSASSGQRAVYEAICNKTGLTLYHKLFQGQEPGHR